MKTLAIAALISAATAGAALAAPDAGVQVTLSPRLQARAHDLGQRDLNELQAELQRTVEHQLARHPLGEGVRLDLVITDVEPDRPTFQQMSNRPGLSYESFGLGGATLDGVITGADGATAPLHYRWYETDICHARFSSTWEDAERAFGFFADHISRGEAVAAR